MAKQIYLLIQKQKIVGINWKGGGVWNRYYTLDKIVLDFNDPDCFKTERQLCNYLYHRFGVGRFKLTAWMQGVKGFFVYWLGNLEENGFIRDKSKSQKEKTMDYWKKELINAKTYQDRQDIQEMMDYEVDDLEDERRNKINKRKILRGPIGLKKSMPGVLHPYQEDINDSEIH